MAHMLLIERRIQYGVIMSMYITLLSVNSEFWNWMDELTMKALNEAENSKPAIIHGITDRKCRVSPPDLSICVKNGTSKNQDLAQGGLGWQRVCMQRWEFRMKNFLGRADMDESVIIKHDADERCEDTHKPSFIRFGVEDNIFVDRVIFVCVFDVGDFDDAVYKWGSRLIQIGMNANINIGIKN